MSFDKVQNLYNKRIIKQIQTIPNKIEIANNKGFFVALIKNKGQLETTENEILEIKETTEVKAEIITEKISFFDRIIQPFKSIMNEKK